MKKIRADKPIGIIIHMFLEILQGNSLCNYLYLKQAKMLGIFFFFLLQNRRTGGQNRSSLRVQGGGWYQWRDGRVRRQEDEYSANSVYTCM
jgi:hypothetical protein